MNVLFVCRGNVGRSQMAEGFFNHYSENHKAISAGTEASILGCSGKEIGEISKDVINCMKELGYDLTHNISKQLTKEIAEGSEMVVWITFKKDVPTYLNNKKVVYWDVEDAGGTSYSFHCKIRDKIKGLVEKLVETLD